MQFIFEKESYLMKNFKSLFLLMLTAIIWGLAFVAQQVGAEYLGTFTFNSIRFLLGSISLIPVILIFERETINKSKFKRLMLSSLITGTVLFVASSLQQYGVELGVPAGKAGFITGLYTVLVPVIALIFLRRRTNLCIWIGAGLAVCGLLLLNLDENFTLSVGAGEISLFAGAVFWAMHILVINKFVEDVSPLKFSMGQFLVCCIESTVCALIFESGTSFADVQSAAVPLFYGGVMSVGVAYTCQILGQKDSEPTFAAIVLSMESVFSVIGGVLLLHAHMEIQGYIGCMLIFGGIVLSQLKIPKASAETSNDKSDNNLNEC